MVFFGSHVSTPVAIAVTALMLIHCATGQYKGLKVFSPNMLLEIPAYHNKSDTSLFAPRESYVIGAGDDSRFAAQFNSEYLGPNNTWAKVAVMSYEVPSDGNSLAIADTCLMVDSGLPNSGQRFIPLTGGDTGLLICAKNSTNWLGSPRVVLYHATQGGVRLSSIEATTEEGGVVLVDRDLTLTAASANKALFAFSTGQESFLLDILRDVFVQTPKNMHFVAIDSFQRIAISIEGSRLTATRMPHAPNSTTTTMWEKTLHETVISVGGWVAEVPNTNMTVVCLLTASVNQTAQNAINLKVVLVDIASGLPVATTPLSGSNFTFLEAVSLEGLASRVKINEPNSEMVAVISFNDVRVAFFDEFMCGVVAIHLSQQRLKRGDLIVWSHGLDEPTPLSLHMGCGWHSISPSTGWSIKSTGFGAFDVSAIELATGTIIARTNTSKYLPSVSLSPSSIEFSSSVSNGLLMMSYPILDVENSTSPIVCVKLDEANRTLDAFVFATNVYSRRLYPRLTKYFNIDGVERIFTTMEEWTLISDLSVRTLPPTPTVAPSNYSGSGTTGDDQDRLTEPAKVLIACLVVLAVAAMVGIVLSRRKQRQKEAHEGYENMQDNTSMAAV